MRIATEDHEVAYMRGTGKRLVVSLGGVGTKPNELVGSAGAVAELMYTRYVVPFEAVSLLLTAAILGTVVLSRRNAQA